MNDIGKRSQIVENQHHVPRFYLKKFSNNNFVQVLDIKTGKILKPKPYAGICYDKFYYGQQTGEKDSVSQILEDFFSILENDIAKGYNPILDKLKLYKQVSDDERFLLSTFASIQWLRGDYMRAQVNRASEEMMKQTMAFQASHPSFEDYVKMIMREKNGKFITDEEIENIKKSFINKEYKLKFDNSLHINLIAEYRGFANMFYAKNWRIHLANGEKGFITSESPVIELFPERKTFYGASFLERKHYLVLSPEVLVEMIYPISGKNLKRNACKDDEVFEYNRLRAEHSQKECYAINKSDLIDLVNYREFREKNYFSAIIKGIE